MEITTVQQGVYQTIYEKILKGEYLPGTQLTFRGLAKDVGVSRTPVEAALNRLAEEGVLAKVPRVGFFTREFTAEDISMIYDLRAMLEAEAARSAAQTISEREVYDLKDALSSFEQRGGERDIERSIAADYVFHRTIAKICKNKYLTGMLEHFRPLIQVTTAMILKLERRHYSVTDEQLYQRHAAIVDAIVAHDQDAAVQVMREHISLAKDEYVQIMYNSASKPA